MYKKIDFETWKRKKLFSHFYNDVRCIICTTVDVDVTKLIEYCRAKGLRFYPTFLYLVSLCVNEQDEFKTFVDKNNDVNVWDTVSPSYTGMGDDDIFTTLYTELDSFDVFYDNACKALDSNKDSANCPDNIFNCSCIPWLEFKHFSLDFPQDGAPYLAPIITWGKYRKCHGKTMMPVAFQIHHAAADGLHIAKFFNSLNEHITVFTSANGE